MDLSHYRILFNFSNELREFLLFFVLIRVNSLLIFAKSTAL